MSSTKVEGKDSNTDAKKPGSSGVLPKSGKDRVVVVDGSYGEGGGQILRNSIAYGCILRQSVELQHIRANRSKPGLRPQHRTAIRLSATVSGGTLTGDEEGSSRVLYKPDETVEPKVGQKRAAGDDDDVNDNSNKHLTFVGDTGTAGSICLTIQCALPCALFLPRSSRSGAADADVCVELVLKGGTNATMAPQVDYFQHVFLPLFHHHFRIPTSCICLDVLRRGYFPRGGGDVRLLVKPLRALAQASADKDSEALPTHFSPIQLTQKGTINHLWIRTFYAGRVPRKVAVEMSNAAVDLLRTASDTVFHLQPTIEIIKEESAVGNGSGLIIVARTDTHCIFAGSALSEGPRQPPAQVGRRAAQELVDTLQDGGCVDEWMQDQLILYMALARGTSEILTGSLTLHTQTAIHVASQLTGATFRVERITDSVRQGEDTPKGEETAVTDRTTTGDESYGSEGRISGRHRVQCDGIGFSTDR